MRRERSKRAAMDWANDLGPFARKTKWIGSPDDPRTGFQRIFAGVFLPWETGDIFADNLLIALSKYA